jgi:hypothetical protein
VAASKKGEDVIANSRNAAKDVAERAGDGAKPRHDKAHKKKAGPKARPHYHPSGNEDVHVFYNIAVGLTVTHWAKECNCMSQETAEAVDLINPLSLANDVREITLMIAGQPTDEE